MVRGRINALRVDPSLSSLCLVIAETSEYRRISYSFLGPLFSWSNDSFVLSATNILCFSMFMSFFLTCKAPLVAGDIVKIDLGCHIDGFIAVAAHTCIVPESADSPPAVPSNKAIGTVAVAAYNAMLVAAASITAGAKSKEVTAAVERVANAYGVKPIASVRMHQMKRYVLDGVKEVALKTPSPDDPEEEQLPECTFEQNEVYAIDVAMSTGDGNARPGTLRTTVFKRNVDQQYSLKVQASALLAEVDKKYPTLPFTLRHLSDIRKARLGIPECVSHGLLTPYPSLHDHSGVVAHFKCTVLLLPSGNSRVTGLGLPSYFETERQPDEETQKVLKTIEEEEAKRAARKANKKNKKKAAK
jgi:curved DNA binding protein